MRDFTKRVNQKEWLLFMLPMILSGGFQCVYSIINTAVAGRYISYEAVAVIGACSGCVSIVSLIFSAMTSGFGIYISRCIGTRQSGRIGQGFWGAAAITCFMSVACLLLSLNISCVMDAARIPQELREDAGMYLCIILLGGGFLGMKNILISTIQGFGDTLFPALVSGIGVVTHTLLVVWLIAGCGFGVSASAAAILLNNAGQAICLAAYLIWKYRKLCPYQFFGKIGLPVYVELLKNGISKSLMFALLSVGTFVMQRMENALSVELLAGDTYADRIYELFTEIISAYGTASVIITGQNVERRQYQVIRDYNRRLMAGGIGWSILFLLISLIAGNWMVEILAGDAALPEVVSAGVLELRVICFGYPLLTALIIYRYTLQTMGEYRAMPFFGLLEMGMNILMAMMISRIGYLAVCLAVLLKWVVPGGAAVIWYHTHMKRCLKTVEKI